jgi:hypothetical protein
MQCNYCKGNIGFWRGLSDRHFCSDEHRRRSRAGSSRNVRESLIYGDEELYEIVTSDRSQKQKHAKLQAQVIVVLSTVMIGILAFAAATRQGGGGTDGLPGKTISLTGEISRNNPMLSQAEEFFKSFLPANGPIKLHEDFRTGLTGWMGGRDSDWGLDAGLIRPGRLRVWKPSMKLSDYKLEFEGQIEKSAMSWAFRAPDLRNYYATKIQVRKAGGLSSADLVRYAVVNGVERGRQRLPMPITIRPDTLYHVQLNVRGNQFVTRVNGQVVDTWSDNRLKRGGVGFFSDRNESSTIHWVDVREERDGIFGRLFAMGFLMSEFASPMVYYQQ